MASVTPLFLRLLITYILYFFTLKNITPYPMKLARMSNTLSFLLHFLVLQKMVRRGCAWLNRVCFVFTSLKARHHFLCTGSLGGGVVT